MKYVMLFILLSIFGCSRLCSYCQEFIEENNSFKYEQHEFVLQRHTFYLQYGNRDSLSTSYNSGTINLIDKDTLEYVKRHMFCFVGLSYDKLNDFIPKQIPFSWDTVGQKYLLRLYPNIGNWNPPYPLAQVRGRGIEKRITWVGKDSLLLHFQKINKKLIFIGNDEERKKYKACD